ncbi:MAG TPA: Uma2 family endonuclease [Pirellulaceae bacterium]|nr:Uma2 family endonuclease [Pirellulaceae bacterium]
MAVTLKKSRWAVPAGNPLLHSGDHLTQREFHRRYEAFPDSEARFELIGGVVYMMSPAGYDHGRGDYRISGLLFQYERATPGVAGAQNVTIILGAASEPQPDNVLLVRPEYGGRVQIKRQGKTRYIVGPPELVFEVAHSSLSIDLHEKRRDYQTSGVLEYIVLDLEDNEVHWFDLATDEPLVLPADRILRSHAFPGFWLDTRALVTGDVARLAACLDQGLSSPEHQRFVVQLAAHRKQRPASRGKRGRQNGA